MSKRSALDSPADSPARDAGKSRGSGWPRDEDRQDDGRWADRGVRLALVPGAVLQLPVLDLPTPGEEVEVAGPAGRRRGVRRRQRRGGADLRGAGQRHRHLQNGAPLHLDLVHAHGGSG